MKFQNVALESVGYCLPQHYVTTAEIERRLEPLYSRLQLPAGRLELMTGIRERRFWPSSALPSDQSIRSGRMAVNAADISPEQIGCLIHASVCRDHLEPATACRVHHELGLTESCLIYDVSNACLGMLNGAIQIANMIELGQIKAGLVVGCESGRSLVETTIDTLNRDETLSRRTIKSAIASLTIGSASAGLLLVERSLSKHGSPLDVVSNGCATQHHQLCQSGKDDAVGDGMQPLMNTNSEALLAEGVAAAKRTYIRLLEQMPSPLDKTVCHQVGSAHQAALLKELELDAARDFATFEWLGNTGSSALPVALAIAAQQSHFSDGDRVGLLGIGSGINVIMMGMEWSGLAVAGIGEAGLMHESTAQA